MIPKVGFLLKWFAAATKQGKLKKSMYNLHGNK